MLCEINIYAIKELFVIMRKKNLYIYIYMIYLQIKIYELRLICGVVGTLLTINTIL